MSRYDIDIVKMRTALTIGKGIWTIGDKLLNFVNNILGMPRHMKPFLCDYYDINGKRIMSFERACWLNAGVNPRTFEFDESVSERC